MLPIKKFGLSLNEKLRNLGLPTYKLPESTKNLLWLTR